MGVGDGEAESSAESWIIETGPWDTENETASTEDVDGSSRSRRRLRHDNQSETRSPNGLTMQCSRDENIIYACIHPCSTRSHRSKRMCWHRGDAAKANNVACSRSQKGPTNQCPGHVPLSTIMPVGKLLVLRVGHGVGVTTCTVSCVAGCVRNDSESFLRSQAEVASAETAAPRAGLGLGGCDGICESFSCKPQCSKAKRATVYRIHSS